MKNKISKCINIIASILAFLFLFGAKSFNVQAAEDDRKFDYIWGSPKGPEKWGDLNPEWAKCKNGRMQSPIDMSLARVKFMSQPKRTIYKPFNAALKKSGYDISVMVQWKGDAGSRFINSTEYCLQEVHWHTPSLHTINGRRYDMKLHMVHESPDVNVENRSVGHPDPFLSMLNASISSLIGQKDEEVNLGVIYLNDIQSGSPSCYRYMGSLTTPPCTEGVIWTVNTNVWP